MSSYKFIKILLSTAVLSVVAYGSCSDLARAYPSVVKGCSGNKLMWRGGGSVKYDDGREKSFNQALNHPSPKDMFRYTYRRGKVVAPSKNYDPGRIRYQPLFFRMYGSSASVARRNLVSINWFGQRIRVTRVNGVASKLKAVERELAKIPNIRKYLKPIGGTFKWRKIAGTNRMSVHSFGAAIDINVKYSAYWRWNKGKYRYQNKIPLSIVKVFEKHGFIWGGRWYHYDTMHFEYRPELLGQRGNRAIRSSTKKEKKQRTKPSTKKGVYVVKSGDTLFSIASSHNTTTAKLRKLNSITDSNLIKIGQKLKVK